MSLTDLNFKNFLEEMDPSLEKKMGNSSTEKDKPIDFFAALGDEAGIEWRVLKKILVSEPWVSTHFTLGSPEINYKTSPWEIVKGSLTPYGGYIRLKKVPGLRSYLKGRRLNKSDWFDDRKYFLTRKELIDFFNHDHTYVGEFGQGAGGAPPMMM